MSLKKDKVFTAVVSVFALAFLGGAGLCVKELLSNSKTQASIEKTQKALKSLANRGNSPALSEENVVLGEENLKSLKDAEARKIALLKGKKAGALAPEYSGDAGTFNSSLRGDVEARAKKLRENEKIVIDPDAQFFGFSRYLKSAQSPSPSADTLPMLSCEQKVVRLLIEQLVSARAKSESVLSENKLLEPGKRLFMQITGVRREATEVSKKEDGAATTPVLVDELSVSSTGDSAGTGLYRLATQKNARGALFPSMRRADAVDAIAFQVSFVAPTSVMRNFLDAFAADGEYPVYVRDVVVTPADSEKVNAAKLLLDPPPAVVPADGAAESADSSADFGALFGGGSVADVETPAAVAPPPVPEKTTVLPETLSEFCVTLEYVSPVEKKSVPEEEKEED